MRRHITDKEQEWLAAGLLGLKEFYRRIGEEFGVEPLDLASIFAAKILNDRLGMSACAGAAASDVSAAGKATLRWKAVVMPFTGVKGFIPGFREQLSKVPGLAPDRHSEEPAAVRPIVLASQQSSTTRRADWIGRESLREMHTLSRQPVQMGRFEQRMTGDPEIHIRPVVRDDKDNVWSCGPLSAVNYAWVYCKRCE